MKEDEEVPGVDNRSDVVVVKMTLRQITEET